MAVRIIYKAAAEAEIEEAYIAYETIRRGLGVEFLDELRRVETHLHANPALYQRVEGDVRRAVLRRFPYGVFYVVDGEQVFGPRTPAFTDLPSPVEAGFAKAGAKPLRLRAGRSMSAQTHDAGLEARAPMSLQ
jgi:toxin ParE1/3/4